MCIVNDIKLDSSFKMKFTTLAFGLLFSTLVAREVNGGVYAKQRKRPKKRCLDTEGDTRSEYCFRGKREYKYYPLTNECKKVTMRWCKGDGSMFKSMANCVAKCLITEQCYMPVVVGDCQLSIPSYYHNHKTGRCEMFIYSGCGGNTNRFGTKQECTNTCCDPCNRDKGTDTCKPNRKRYTYDHVTGECVEGCGGGKNKFKTLEECRGTCLVDVQCELPPKTGPCRGSFTRYYYKPSTDTCETFTYGGCQGNENRFPSAEACRRTCIHPGQCPTVTGAGACVELCLNDASCPVGEKCCSNGCGHVCMTAVPLPP